MNRPIRIALLLVIAGGCGGNSAQKQLFNERQSTCNGIIGRGDATDRVAFLYETIPAISDCRAPNSTDPRRPPYVPLSGDGCNYSQPVCERTWQFSTSDGSECGTFGCCYRCKVRSQATSTDDLGEILVFGGAIPPTVSSTPACQVSFSSQQPCVGPVFF